MVDYVTALKDDLLEQFKGKEKINVLMDVIGKQLQDVYHFYQQLLTERDIVNAVGKQLDGVGDIVVMTRMEAGQLAGDPIPFDVIEDDDYRKYLIYKILKNTCNCTYADIIKAFRMFWDQPLYYSEDPNRPATMIFETDWLSLDDHPERLFKIPIIRAAGVGIDLKAKARLEDPITLGAGGAFLGTHTKYTAEVPINGVIDWPRVHVSANGGVATKRIYQKITIDITPVALVDELDCYLLDEQGNYLVE